VSKKTNPFRTTVLGGLIFLVPFVVVLLVLGKALAIMKAVATPIAEAIGIDHIGALAMIDLLAVLLLVGLCWLAGHAATSQRGRALYESFDEKLLNLFPRYGFVKSMTESLAENRPEATLPVVLVHFDDQSQLGFEVERSVHQVIVFLPGSPDPWAGALSLVTPDRVQKLDVDFKTAVKSIRLLGRGGGKFASLADRA
jgi:uncharacterized membrane protein